MKTGVTGGSGVVGRSVVRHLVAAGHEVSALARSDAAASGLEAEGAGTVRGNVLDPKTLTRLVAGCVGVFHVAGINQLCPADPARMDLVNIEGTRNVIRAARDAAVQRLVHTSSAVVIGERHGTIGT
ncbi:MAG TPA: NAD-dependent epimerase/dehydratase family protein, partial [Acidimicrobiia bacterium]|nr:NAD-dependent epimerase/dehydratase family protein [Acidimicrobiia bacterium]